MFGIIWSERKQRYIICEMSKLSVEERMLVEGVYNKLNAAKAVLKKMIKEKRQ